LEIVPVDPSTAEEGSSWRELAVARSLDTARARAEKRVQRFLDAALELMASSDNQDFTVQQVVERSGQSLRSFYQYFEGKYELLLALFEESIAQTAEQLADAVAGTDDPLERVRIFVAEYYRRCTPAPKGKKTTGVSPNPLAIAEFAQQLMTEHPKEASKAFGPVVILFVQLLDDAVEAGVVRGGFDHRRVAGVLLQAIMFNSFAATISGLTVRDGDEALLDLLLHGIAAD
jgi:AcrR family transcriptional regulator